MIKKIFILVFLFLQLKSHAQSYNADLLIYKTNISVDENKLKKELYFEIKINNRAGDEYAKIAIPYSKLEKVSNLKAFIKDSKGSTVKKLKNSEITEKSEISDFSFYEDNFVKEFTLKHNTYPYTIVCSYKTQQDEFIYIDYWTPIVDEEIPTHDATLNVSIPLNYNIAFRNQHVDSPVIDTLTNTINYQWHTSYHDIITPEEFSPPITNFLPSVAIIPTEFNYEINGSFKDWVTFGNWQYELLQGLNELPESEKRKVQTLIKDSENDKEKIKILYHYLQDETRYINVSIETGGLKPYPASYVANNKYGDCKALTNYFKSMLDYIGIKSYYSKVNSGNPIEKINKDFASQQFNHIILYIPDNEEDIWLDCTSKNAFAYLGTFSQNRDAFIIDYNNSRFLKTPPLKPFDVLETRRIEISYESNRAIIRVQNTFKGDMYENIIYLEKTFNKSDKSKIVRNYLVEDGLQLADYQLIKQNRDSVKIKLSYEATSQNIYKHYGNDILISNITFSIPNFTKPEERKLPVQIDYPILKIDTLIYDVPKGYELNKNGLNHSISNRFGHYKLNIKENTGKLIVSKSLLVNSGTYPLSDYPDFYSFYEKIIELENKTLLSLSK